MKTKTPKRMTQRRFFTLLGERARTHGFYCDESGALREKTTENCPVVAVAEHLGLRGYRQVCNHPAASAMNLHYDFCDQVADAADAPDRSNRLRQRLLGIVDVAEVA